MPTPSPAPFKVRDNSDLIGTMRVLARNFGNVFNDPDASSVLIEASCNSLVCTLALLQQRLMHEHDRMKAHILGMFHALTIEDQQALEPKLRADVADICRNITSALALYRDMALAVVRLMDERGLPPNAEQWRGFLN